MGKNYGIGSILTIKTKPVTHEYEDGYAGTFHRRCRSCKAIIDAYPQEAQWCQVCKGEDAEKESDIFNVMCEEIRHKNDWIEAKCKATPLCLAPGDAEQFDARLYDRMSRLHMCLAPVDGSKSLCNCHPGHSGPHKCIVVDGL